MAKDVIVFEPGSKVDAFWCGRWWPDATVNRNAKGGFRVTWADGSVSTVEDIRKPRKAYAVRPLRGEVVVFTGTLENMRRREAEARALRSGAKVGRSVSTKTTLVVVGADAGAKAYRANKLGVRMITEEAFLKLAA